MKPLWVLLFLDGYDANLSIISFTILVILIAYLGVKHSVKLTHSGCRIAVGLLFAFILIPFTLFEVRMVDIRVLSAAFLIIPAYLNINISHVSAKIAGMITSAIIILNTSYAAHVWFAHQPDYKSFKSSFALLRPQSLVLIGQSRNEVPETLLTDAPIYYAPVLAAYYAKAFVPLLYTSPSAQPIRVRADLTSLDVAAGLPPSLALLKATAQGQEVVGTEQYLNGWPANFDYLYLLGPNLDNPLPEVLDQVATHKTFTLYRIRKDISSDR